MQNEVQQAPGTVTMSVNLPKGMRGIHMSRLYLLLDQFSRDCILGQSSIQDLVDSMLQTHEDCCSDHAKVEFAFTVMRRNRALVSDHLSGWRKYPAKIVAMKTPNGYSFSLEVTIVYSSACPCSSALVRQYIESEFKKSHPVSQVSTEQAADWIRDNATIAIPHSQRSQVTICLTSDQEQMCLDKLIDTCEASLKTPVQTAVKRIDELEFAKVNGENQMFVEDAVRRLQYSLAELFPNGRFTVDVDHLESLHSHDAYARMEFSR
jgi:GTP cyclohydrolase I